MLVMVMLSYIPVAVSLLVYLIMNRIGSGKGTEENKKKVKKKGRFRPVFLLVSMAVSGCLVGLMTYFLLPALSIQSGWFWIILLIGMAPYLFAGRSYFPLTDNHWNSKPKYYAADYAYVSSIIVYLGFCVVLVISMIASAKIFHAKKYAEVLQIEEGTVEDLPDVSENDTDRIALMDTESAAMLGDRELGTMDDTIVSQFDVRVYCQLNISGNPAKIADLGYGSVWKWAKSRTSGIPGYIYVDPVGMTAEYRTLSEPLVYTPGSYFSEDLDRRIRAAFPYILFGNTHLELDDMGKPWYVSSIYTHKINVFGAKDVTGAVISDPVTGEMKKYDLEDVPEWVDYVIDGDLLCDQYDWYGSLRNGFWNSIIGQKGCRKTTDVQVEDSDGYSHSISDYGYIAQGNDIWIYTGVTSLGHDSSNLGFLLANERTGQAKYITCSGADEMSAMNAAQGEVQEKGYTASFPSLVRVSDAPVYLMVLKDDNSLVKLYAAVDVQQYNIVATGETLNECLDQYAKLTGNGGTKQNQAEAETEQEAEQAEESEPDLTDAEEKIIQIRAMQAIDQDGTTYLYVMDEDRNIYYARYTDVLGMMDKQVGDEVTIRTDGIRFELVE